MKRKLLIPVLILSLVLCGCGATEPEPVETAAVEAVAPTPSSLGIDDDIVVLYTNDVHCAIDDNLGYTGLAAVKNALEIQGKSVVLADVGDALQGDAFGTLSEGEYILDIMNSLGYAVAVPGNHEFDYGLERFTENVSYADFPYVSCNFVDKDDKTVLPPYYVMEVDGVKLAFVGITTPKTLSTTSPKAFQNDRGKYLYGFCQDETGEKLYAAVQSAVDAAIDEGAQVVIALAHLGSELDCSPWTSSEVINNTSGIDVMLDGHSHSVMEQELVKNKLGKEVILSSTGTKLENIGCLTIDNNGKMDTKLIGDGGIGEIISGLSDEYSELLDKVVAHTDVELTITDPETGERMVRQNETNLGDLCADAYKYVSGADIAIVNGGGIRESIPAGDITYGNIIAVHPFGNQLCVVEATGQEILDALELGVSKLPAESGGFLQVAGLSYLVDMNVESGVVLDANGMFSSVVGDRRVRDVMVGDAAIDPTATYTLAGTNYYLKDSGDGFNMFEDNVLLQDSVMIDNQVLISYIVDALGGTVGEDYIEPYGQSRIVFRVAN